MRELTQQEIDNAPERFDAYYMDGHGGLRLLNTQSVETCSVKMLPEVAGVSFFSKDHYSLKTCKPIPRKPFDINEYQFDYDVCLVKRANSYLRFRTPDHDIAELSKQDVIAMAKHFNLTAEDLR